MPERRIEQCEAIRRRHRDQAATAHPRAIALVEMACHPGGLRPQSHAIETPGSPRSRRR